AYRVMRRLLPGPYCVELEATREVPRMLMEKRRVVGIRVPESAFVQELLTALGRPLVASGPTAPGGEAPLPDADALEQVYGKAVGLIAGGGFLGDLPSTVIRLVGDEFHLRRQGKGRVEF